MLNHTLHVVFTDVLPSNFEARSVLECSVKIVWAHYLVVLVKVTALWDVPMHVLNYNGVRRANLKSINLSALSQEDSNGVFITNLEPWFHQHAFSIPKCVKVWFAKPLATTLNVILMVCSQLDALIMLYISSELLEVHHCMPEKSVLLT